MRHLLVAALGAALALAPMPSDAYSLTGPWGLAPPAAKATFEIARTGNGPPVEDAALSPCYHPGLEVYLPTGAVVHTRRIAQVACIRDVLDFELFTVPHLDYDGPYGRSWWHSFHSFLEIAEDGSVALHDVDGRVHEFAVDGNAFTTPPGSFSVLEAQRKGRKQKVKSYTLHLPDGGTRVYDKKGRWKSLLCPDGTLIKLKFTKTLQLKTIKTSLKETFKLKYGKEKRLTQLQIPGKRRFSFEHDDDGHLTAIRRPLRDGDAAPLAWTYEYDIEGRLLSVFNSAGERRATAGYDVQGRCASITLIDSKAAMFTYDTGFVTCTNVDGFRHDVHFDGNGQITQIERFDGLGGGDIETIEHDALLRRTRNTRPSGEIFEWTYKSGTDPRDLRNVTTFTHTPADFPINDPRVTTFTYEPQSDRMTSETLPGGAVRDYSYDTAGRLTSVTLPAVKTELGDVRPTTTYEYDALGRRTAIVHPDGARDEFSYPKKKPRPDLVLEERLDVNGVDRRVTYDYDVHGNLVRQRLSDQVTQTYEYDQWGNLTASTDPGGVRTIFVYDDAGRQTRISRPFQDDQGNDVGSGFATRVVTYDALGRVVRESENDAFGPSAVTTYEFGQGIDKPTAIVDPAGTRTEIEYDFAGRIAEFRKAVGTGIETEDVFVYDAFGRVETHLDPLNRGPVSFPNGFGQEEFVLDGEGGFTFYDYDVAGRRSSRVVEDAIGDTLSSERYLYDPSGRLIEIQRDRIDPCGPPTPIVETTTNCYTLRGFPHIETDAAGATTTYEYDGLGRILSETHQPLDLQKLYTYDDLDRLIAIEEIRGVSLPNPPDPASRTIEYDALGNVTRMVTEKGAELVSTYDTLGNVITATDPAGSTVRYTYDALSRELSNSRPNPSGTGDVTNTYTYDVVGNLTQLDGADGNTVTYTYDPLGRMIDLSRNGNLVVTYTYDLAGQVETRTDGSGRTITWDYDQLGRVIQRTATSGEIQVMSWDANNRLRTSSDTGNVGIVTLDRCYDTLGNRSLDSVGGRDVIRTFDSANRPATLLVPDGFLYEFTTDAAGRITGMDRDQSTYLETDYVPGTRKPAEQRHPAMTSTYTYDPAGKLLRTDFSTTAQQIPDEFFETSRDALGRREWQRRSNGAGQRWEYDSLGRLERHFSESDDPASDTPTTFEQRTVFTYDAVNRLQTGVMSSVVGINDDDEPALGRLTYDALGRLASYDGVAFSYAGNGHATNWFETRESYVPGFYDINVDAFGRVTEVRRNADNALVGRYQYDVLNRPVLSAEEEFTGNNVLNRFRVFDGCRLVQEGPATIPFGGFNLFFVINPSGRGHVASGFKDQFFAESLWQTDCSEIPRAMYNTDTLSYNETYRRFDPFGHPIYENIIGQPFRGPPSLNTLVNSARLANSPATGLVFDWAAAGKDPHAPRPLDIPAPQRGVFDIPFPRLPGPGVGGGLPGVNDEEWPTDPRPEDLVVDSACEDALADFEHEFAQIDNIFNAAARCLDDLDRVNRKRRAHLGKLDAISEALDEILEAQNKINKRIDQFRTADFAFDALTQTLKAGADIKDARKSVKNFQKMGGSTLQLFGGASGKQARKAQADFAEAFTEEAGKLIKGEAVEFAGGKVNEAIRDTGVFSNSLGLSGIGGAAVDFGARLAGGKTYGELLAEYARQFETGIANRPKLKASLERLKRIEQDRLAFKEYLSSGLKNVCARAEVALDKIAEVWGEDEVAELRKKLAAEKAYLASEKGIR